MGRKRKYISEDEYRIQANECQREIYAKKVAEKQKHIQESGEHHNKDSCNTDVVPVSSANHTLVDVPVDNHVSLSALLKAKCMCYEIPVVDFSDKSIVQWSSTNDAIDQSILHPPEFISYTGYQIS